MYKSPKSCLSYYSIGLLAASVVSVCVGGEQLNPIIVFKTLYYITTY